MVASYHHLSTNIALSPYLHPSSTLVFSEFGPPLLAPRFEALASC